MAIDEAGFADWLDRYGRAWEQRDPDKAAVHFADQAS